MSLFATFDPRRIERYAARKRRYKTKDRIFSTLLVTGWISTLIGLCVLLVQGLMRLVG